MSLTRRAGFIAKHAVLWACVTVTVFAALLAAVGFFIAAVYLELARPLGPPAAAALTGLALVLVAGLAGFGGFTQLAKLRQRPPAITTDLGALVGVAATLASNAVRNAPRKSLLLALLAGLAVALPNDESR